MGTSASTATSMLVCRLADSEEPPAALRIGVERGSGTRHLLQVCTNLSIGTTLERFSFEVWFSHDELHGDGGETNDSGVSMNQPGGAGGARNRKWSITTESLDGILLDWWYKHGRPTRRPMLAQTQAQVRARAQAIAHGGGASMVAQTNDSDIHVDRRFIGRLLAHCNIRMKKKIKKNFAEKIKKNFAEKMSILIKNRALMKFGYDPDMRNIDQSPFHRNEAGSAARNTLALTGAPIVPLIENHAATRERWSLTSPSTL